MANAAIASRGKKKRAELPESLARGRKERKVSECWLAAEGVWKLEVGWLMSRGGAQAAWAAGGGGGGGTAPGLQEPRRLPE